MSKRLFPLLLLASALWQLSMANPVDPTITPAAVLPRQEVDNDFIGWFLKTSGSTSSWVASSCQSGETWQQTGQNAQCCPKTFQRCYVRTACIETSGLAYMAFTDSALSSEWWSACTDAYSNPAYSVCNTAFVYESYDKLKEPQTNMICGPSNVNEVYYRTIPASLTEQVSTSSTSSLPGTSISSSPGTSSTTSVAPVQTPASKSDSKAWIAGAVAGPVLGLALIGAGVWLFLRRKKKAAQPTQHGVAATSHIDLSRPPAGVGGYTDSKPQYQPVQHIYPSPAQSQAYPQQGGFSPPQVSPAPQYGFSPPNNTTPSPSMGSYAHDAKYEFNRGAEAAELGGSSTIVPESTNQRP